MIFVRSCLSDVFESGHANCGLLRPGVIFFFPTLLYNHSLVYMDFIWNKMFYVTLWRSPMSTSQEGQLRITAVSSPKMLFLIHSRFILSGWTNIEMFPSTTSYAPATHISSVCRVLLRFQLTVDPHLLTSAHTVVWSSQGDSTQLTSLRLRLWKTTGRHYVFHTLYLKCNSCRFVQSILTEVVTSYWLLMVCYWPWLHNLFAAVIEQRKLFPSLLWEEFSAHFLI